MPVPSAQRSDARSDKRGREPEAPGRARASGARNGAPAAQLHRAASAPLCGPLRPRRGRDRRRWRRAQGFRRTAGCCGAPPRRSQAEPAAPRGVDTAQPPRLHHAPSPRAHASARRAALGVQAEHSWQVARAAHTGLDCDAARRSCAKHRRRTTFAAAGASWRTPARADTACGVERLMLYKWAPRDARRDCPMRGAARAAAT